MMQKWSRDDPDMDDTVNTGLSISLVPLPESVLTKICDDILSRWAAELRVDPDWSCELVLWNQLSEDDL